MPLITRLTPADLQQVQQQTSADAAISDVIKSLQSSKSTEVKPLNTICPTCSVKGSAFGYLSATANGTPHHYLCPTCVGYALVYTQGGELQPPVNPFESPLTVSRLLPSDLIEALVAFPDVDQIGEMINALIANRVEGAQPLGYVCGLCSGTGQLKVKGNQVYCYLCNGMQKTELEYDSNGVVIIPNVPPPTNAQ